MSNYIRESNGISDVPRNGGGRNGVFSEFGEIGDTVEVVLL